MVGRLRRQHQARHQRIRLNTHVGEQIDHRLLDVGIDRRFLKVMIVVETPGPVDGAGAEDKRSALARDKVSERALKFHRR